MKTVRYFKYLGHLLSRDNGLKIAKEYKWCVTKDLERSILRNTKIYMHIIRRYVQSFYTL